VKSERKSDDIRRNGRKSGINAGTMEKGDARWYPAERKKRNRIGKGGILCQIMNIEKNDMAKMAILAETYKMSLNGHCY